MRRALLISTPLVGVASHGFATVVPPKMTRYTYLGQEAKGTLPHQGGSVRSSRSIFVTTASLSSR